MSQTAMKWTVILLLFVIIVLLSVCLYLDIDFSGGQNGLVSTPGGNSSSTDTTAVNAFATDTAPITYTSPVLTGTETPETDPPVTSIRPPVSTPVPTTEAPETTTVPETTEPPSVTTERPYDPDAPTICIDPGHGFTDPGAVAKLNGKEVYESTINLEISLHLKESLEKMGYNVILTHDGVNLPDEEYLSETSPRYNVNNRRKWILDRKDSIDLVISVHCNTYSTPTPSGSRYYILRTDDEGYNSRSYTLMTKLLQSVKTAFGLSKEPSWARQDLAVLKNGLPSVLLECGFLTNPGDLAQLVDAAWQTRYAQAIAEGIAAYCKAYVTK